MLWIGIFVGLTFRGEGATMAVQVLVWPIGFLSTAIVSAETMPGWLGAIAAWNPLSATATATRQLFGNPTGITEGPLADHAVWLAVGWPLLIAAVFLPLSARAYRKLRTDCAGPDFGLRTDGLPRGSESRGGPSRGATLAADCRRCCSCWPVALPACPACVPSPRWRRPARAVAPGRAMQITAARWGRGRGRHDGCLI